jgi:hypothetical protein
MQRHLQRFVTLENIQKRSVTVVEGLLKDVVEIADGLMIVQRED